MKGLKVANYQANARLSAPLQHASARILQMRVQLMQNQSLDHSINTNKQINIRREGSAAREASSRNDGLIDTPPDLIICWLCMHGLDRHEVDVLLYDCGVRLPASQWQDNIPPKSCLRAARRP